MSTCGLARPLLVAFAAGAPVATISGHDAYGWVAAAAVLAVAAILRRRRGSPSACALPVPAEARRPAE